MASNANLLFVETRRELVDYATGIVGSTVAGRGSRPGSVDPLQRGGEGGVSREPRNYLYRIVRNLALDGRRRREVERRIFNEQSPEVVASLPDAAPSAEQASIDRDNLRLLQEALRELPKRTRIAFEMHRLQGCKLREIAAVLDVSIPTAQLLVMDALQHCKSRLGWP